MGSGHTAAIWVWRETILQEECKNREVRSYRSFKQHCRNPHHYPSSPFLVFWAAASPAPNELSEWDKPLHISSFCHRAAGEFGHVIPGWWTFNVPDETSRMELVEAAQTQGTELCHAIKIICTLGSQPLAPGGQQDLPLSSIFAFSCSLLLPSFWFFILPFLPLEAEAATGAFAGLIQSPLVPAENLS